MNPYFEKGLSKEVHPLVKVTASVVLCLFGCLCSILWIITKGALLGSIGLLSGPPSMFMGVALLLGKVKLISGTVRIYSFTTDLKTFFLSLGYSKHKEVLC